jgi:hypothetical protein
LLDKTRATVAGKNGEYVYGAMMSRQFLEFTGIDAVAFLDRLLHRAETVVLEGNRYHMKDRLGDDPTA